MFQLTIKNSNKTVLLSDIKALRISFVVAGLLVLGGAVATIFISQYFLILPMLVAGGLLFSGIIGFCPMAIFIEKLFIR